MLLGAPSYLFTLSLHQAVDKLHAHSRAAVKKYVPNMKGRLFLHLLPGYTPNLNPYEVV
jgi:hypothetical protein